MSYNKECLICKKNYISQQPNTKYCSNSCRTEREGKRWGRYSDKSLATATVGAVSEIMVAADLMKKGYAVFRALSAACLCDLIIFKDGVFKRIEVRTGYKGENGKITFPTPTRDVNKQDCYAVYIRASDEIFYLSPKREELFI